VSRPLRDRLDLPLTGCLLHAREVIDVKGQVVLVTGAGRGLGEAYARLLAARGAHLAVHDAGVDRDGSGVARSSTAM
jgi:NADPH:quinone reductase-like Zn-dependent oxidoreductase